jgi:hypothetical protein
VFLSYAHEDRQRAEQIVARFKRRGIPVWWDDLLLPGADWNGMLREKIRYASGFVVLWSEASVRALFVQAEALAAYEDARGVGRLISVLLDAGAQRDIPLPFNALQHVDLSGEGRKRTPELAKLVRHVGALVRRPPEWNERTSNLDDAWSVADARRASERLRSLTEEIGSLAQILVSDIAAVVRVRAALDEVDRTLDVVSAAIGDFVAAGLVADELDPRPYLRFERGDLQRRIRAGKGHCDLIALHYESPDGVRAWLEANASAAVKTRADAVFRMLGTADGDVFLHLSRIGEVLTSEARIVVNLLVGGQPDAARERVLAGRQKLAPLEADLQQTIEVLQDVESSLGYARSG